MPVDKDFNQVESNSVKTGGPTETSITTTIVNSLVDAEPLADDGETYPTVQDAENAASSWVFVPPGTFEENISVDTQNLMLVGSGNSTFIDGGASGDAINSTADNVTFKNFKVQCDPGSSDRTIYATSGNSGLISNVNSTGTGGIAIQIEDNETDWAIIGSRCSDSGSVGFRIDGIRGIISSCIATSNANRGTRCVTGDCVESSNIVDCNNVNGSGGMGPSTDSVSMANRIIDADVDGIEVFGSNVILANNRVSGSGNTEINDGGTATIFDGNLTG